MTLQQPCASLKLKLWSEFRDLLICCACELVGINSEARHRREKAALLTEDQVQRSFRNLFKSKDFPLENFDKAENLLDELRAESPLRHRLSVELEELRKMHTAKAR